MGVALTFRSMLGSSQQHALTQEAHAVQCSTPTILNYVCFAHDSVVSSWCGNRGETTESCVPTIGSLYKLLILRCDSW